jgi:hypothetical protein
MLWIENFIYLVKAFKRKIPGQARYDSPTADGATTIQEIPKIHSDLFLDHFAIEIGRGRYRG